MNIRLVCPVLVLDNEKNKDIKKLDVKKLKLLVDNNYNLLAEEINDNYSLKDILKSRIKSIIGSKIFHLEQVYTLGEEQYSANKTIDIIYLAITNIENIKNLKSDYKLIDFNVSNNTISFDNNNYSFETKEKISNNNIEYFHTFDVDNLVLEKKLLEILIAYKHLRMKIDNSDIVFKFLPKYFTLEDVRVIYEMIKEVTVDKSNFRKRIVKYCVESDADMEKKGYRPSKLYSFNVLKGDIWL